MRACVFIGVFCLVVTASPATRLRQHREIKYDLRNSATISDCGEGKAEIKFSNMTVTPVDPQRGQNITFEAFGITSKPISGGSGQLQVTINGSPIFSHGVNTCGQTVIELPLGLGNAIIEGVNCPLPAGGNTTISGSLILPTIAPAGSFAVTLTSNDQGQQEAYCGLVTLILT